MTTPAIGQDVLEALMSPDNQLRTAAEQYLQSMAVEDRCMALLHSSAAVSPALQQLCCILLRRNVSKLTNVGFLVSMVRMLMAQVNIQSALSNDTIASLLKESIAQAIGILSLLKAHDEATKCLEQVLQANAADAMQGNMSALKLLIALAEQAPVAFGKLVMPSLPRLIDNVLQQLNANQFPSSQQIVSVLLELVVQTALATTASADQPWQSMPSVKRLQDSNQQHDAVNTPLLMELGLNCLLPILTSSGFCPTDHTVLEHLLTASESVPFLFGAPAVWNAIMQACLHVMISSDHLSTDDAIFRRLQALQIVVNLCQVTGLQQTLLDAASRTSICETATRLLVGVLAGDYNTEYNNNDFDEDEEDQLVAYASDLLEQLVHVFVDPAMPFAMQHIETKLAAVMQHQSSQGYTSNWRASRGALVALQCCLEAAPVKSSQHFVASMEAALWFSSCNVDERVQYVAIRLVGALCESRRCSRAADFEGMASRILQTLAQAVQSTATKVATMACTAIVAYCRPTNAGLDLDAERLVLPFLSDVLNAIVAGPLSKNAVSAEVMDAKVAALAAVACLAEAAEEAFIPIYAHIMPGLWSLINLPASGGSNSYEISRLKGAAVETATIIFQAIGEDNVHIFQQDAEAIMNLAASLLRTSMEGDIVAGMPLDQLLSGCARIASVMKEKFAPFMGAVFSPLLLRATDTSGDVEISDGADTNTEATDLYVDDDGKESITVTLPGRGLTNITINTSKIQEKAQAARAMYELASALGASFGPYAKACLDSFLVLVGFKYSAEIRSTASQTLAAAFEAACASGEGHGWELPAEYFPVISKVLAQGINVDNATDMDETYAFAESTSQVFYSVYSRREDSHGELLSKFSIEEATFVTKLCVKALAACLQRRDKITAALSVGISEDEFEEYTGVLEKEGELLTPLTDAIGYMLKLHREKFLPTFQTKVVPVLGPYLRSSTDLQAKLAAVCLFDDCVEFCGGAAASTHGSALMEGVVTGLDDSTNGGNMELKRASIYGVAQVARYAPSSALLPHAQQVIPALLAIVSKTKDDYGDCPGVFENAVSALGSLALFGKAPLQKYIKQDLAISVLLANLPLREDFDEAEICSIGFCELVEKGTVPMDEECDNILRIIGDTLASVNDGDDLASEATIIRFVGILFGLQQSVSSHVMNRAFGKISGESQEAINASMNNYRHMFTNVVTPEK
ncbi:hypothetical protein MPSEU_001022500 [Mayamaea pseudoterrestris]|nr:hypothetical protein MPSEU_001022500 [Mayamaea pseudoterrestris]